MSRKRIKIDQNKIFGLWTVLTGNTKMIKRHSSVLCRCICGKRKWVLTTHLIGGKSKSCSPSRHKKGKNHPLFSGFGHISGNFIDHLKRNGRSRNHLVSVNAKQLDKLLISQNFKCALSNLPISLKNKTASLDRIDNTKGYKLGNIQWIHKLINIMKNTLPQELFIAFCHKITENTEEPKKINFDLKWRQF